MKLDPALQGGNAELAKALAAVNRFEEAGVQKKAPVQTDALVEMEFESGESRRSNYCFVA